MEADALSFMDNAVVKQPFVQADENNTCVDCFHIMVAILGMFDYFF
jgi:hypothetical protein